MKQFGKEGDYLIKFEKKNFDDKNNIKTIKENVKNKLQTDVNFRRVENVGPKVSNELLNAGLIAISLSLAAMLFYIWIRFEWQFSLGAIIALIHDVIVVLGVFSIFSFDFDLTVLAALLAVIGYSLNDTIVVSDRIRENLRIQRRSDTVEIINLSLNQMLSRTLITSLTTLLVLLSLYLFGGEIIKNFALALIFGVIVGTYSSIYIASNALIIMGLTSEHLIVEEKENQDFDGLP